MNRIGAFNFRWILDILFFDKMSLIKVNGLYFKTTAQIKRIGLHVDTQFPEKKPRTSMANCNLASLSQLRQDYHILFRRHKHNIWFLGNLKIFTVSPVAWDQKFAGETTLWTFWIEISWIQSYKRHSLSGQPKDYLKVQPSMNELWPRSNK